MSKAQLLAKYESLPDHLKLMVDNFIDSLSSQKAYPQSKEDLASPTSWAEEPDHTALYGLAKNNPLNLEDIRRKNWER